MAPIVVLEEGLGQHLGGDILAGGAVQDLDLLALADPLGDLLQGDIAALFGVVELPASASIALDHPDHV
jgi:hypothetical protein